MLGAITGDIISSVFENHYRVTKDFELFHGRNFFTEVTVLTIAVADSILNNVSYEENIKKYCLKYPGKGFRGKLLEWAKSSNSEPYNGSCNGSAMRVSPIGYAFSTLEETLEEAKKSAECTHNHPDGITGAQAVAGAIFLARTGKSKEEISDFISNQIGYYISDSFESLKGGFCLDENCGGTVPQAIICFLESKSFEDAIRNAVSIGGESDDSCCIIGWIPFNLACITGAIAESFYGGVPDYILDGVTPILNQDFLNIINKFKEKYIRKG